MSKNQTNVPKLNKNIFPYDFYLAYWIDTTSKSEWENLETAKFYKPSVCVTTGWLISTKNNSHTFVSDIGFDETNQIINECGSATTIPTPNIIKLVKIKEIIND